MKFYSEQVAGQGHKRYLFALGKAETEILHATLSKACEHFPQTILTQTTHHRMKGMLSEMTKALKDMEYQTEDDYCIAHENKVS